mgnify:FL=1
MADCLREVPTGSGFSHSARAARRSPGGRVGACQEIWVSVEDTDMSSDREATQRRRRHLHEQLRALSHEPLMRGSVVERRRKCGKPNCACASDPDARHGGQVVTVFLDGRTQVVSLRAEDESRVRAAVEAYERAWRIINGLTQCELSDLRRETRERHRARKRRAK